MGLASLQENSYNASCTGNSSQICGGQSANSVYMIAKHMGCFKDCGTNVLSANDFLINSLNSTSLTAQMCLASCRASNFKYAGLQSG